MTTMEPLPGVMVVDYTCATNPDQCDVGGNVSYNFNESLSKKGPCNDIKNYYLTDTFMPLKTCKTVDRMCMTPRGEKDKVCADFDFSVITDIIVPTPRTKEEINL